MTVMSATISAERAIVGSIPGMAEHPMNGNTPRESWPARSTQRVITLRKLVCRLNAVAFAYPYVTRHGESGQRTGRVHLTRDALGAAL